MVYEYRRTEPTIRLKLWMALKNAGEKGLTLAEMVDIAYGDKPEGGPLGAIPAIRAHLWLLNRDIEHLELQIKCIRIYRIESRSRR